MMLTENLSVYIFHFSHFGFLFLNKLFDKIDLETDLACPDQTLIAQTKRKFVQYDLLIAYWQH